MKQFKLTLIVFALIILNSCSTSFPNEILGKYNNPDGGGYIELNVDKTFTWFADGEAVVNGSFYIKASEYNTAGYDSYYTIITEAKSGNYMSQWGVTDHIRHWNGSYDLRQDISNQYFIFKKME